MIKRGFAIAKIFRLVLLILSISACSSEEKAKPNIVIVLCDDLGYGDVQSLNPERGKIATPFIDQLARQGMVFTDAHSGSSVCTPTRYGLLTGRYSWRSRLQAYVVSGFDDCLIAPDRPTIASFLKEQGYLTTIIGKWHLNYNYIDSTGTLLKKPKDRSTMAPIGSTIPDGPVTHGFDSYHGFHHSQHMAAIIENNKVVEYDDVVNMLPRIKNKSVEYINDRASNKSGQPFFMYIALNSPHTPHVPAPEWQGKSGISTYADFVMQTDATLGAIVDALDRNGFKDNTLVIFSSDNGCSGPASKEHQLQKEFGHYSSAHMRGSKADIWDGGHRVPFIVRWPRNVEAGSQNDELICLTDLFTTCADILDEPVPETSCEDSYSFLDALYGDSLVSDRKGIVHHSISGHFGYRMGKWKLCLAKGSGGWTSPKEKEVPEGTPIAQLYDLEEDPSETTNLYESHPEIVEQLLKQLEYEVKNGRSTPGPESPNDLNNNKIKLWKNGKN